MTKIYYKTKLLWTKNKKHIIPFYIFNNNIGYVPADIHFIYRKKEYNTIIIMNALVKNITISDNFKCDYWYDMNTGEFNKKNFIKFQNKLI